MKTTINLKSLNINNEVVAKFWSQVDKHGPLPDQSNPWYKGLSNCWTWTGSKNTGGYGQMRINKKQPGVHRISWFIHHGDVNEDLLVCHKCDNPSCVNPDHLSVGAQADNMLDKSRKKRGKVPFNERNGKTKFSSSQVATMRLIYDTGLFSIKELAIKFSVSDQNLSKILRLKSRPPL